MWRCANCEQAEQDWHPRFSARRRHYRYTVLNQALRSPLDRRYAHLVTEPLDLAALQAAAETAGGRARFRQLWPAHAGRQHGALDLQRPTGSKTGRGFAFDVVGNAFLRGMVRSLVGSLLQVGTGAWPVERIGAVLAARDRALAAAPGTGLWACV